MVWTLIALLVYTLGAEADRYADYEGARMPHYNMEEGNHDAAPLPEDDVERSPDAPASLDYKYEEDFKDKIDKLPMKIEEEGWHKRSKKLKERLNPIEDDVGKYENESFLKSKATRKNRKHRTRYKNNDFNRDYRDSGREATKSVRSRKIDADDVDIRNDYYINKVRVREDNNIDSNNFNFRDTTEKIIRRKPRDRSISRRRSHDEDIDDDEEDVKPFEREIDTEDAENQSEGRRRFIPQRPPPTAELTKIKHKNYPDYNDYYDMKRVQNMKNKLPALLRKTQASTTATPSTRHLQDITYRRVNPPEKTTDLTPNITTTPRTTTITTSDVPTDIIPISKKSTDMSLAEKSRLSILKKAQRKDNVRNVTWTTKPPVLMQVTRATTTRTTTSVAERELKALLGHRQRKEVNSLLQTTPLTLLPTTFPPNAVDPIMNDEWNRFLSANSSRKLQHSIYVITIMLINCLQYYR